MDRATRERIAKQFQKVTDESMVMNQLSPKFSDTGREVNLGEYLDAYTGAPVRTLARGLLTGSETPWKDAAKQFGKDPINAPTGKDIANDLGVSSKKLLELDKPLNSYGTIPSAIMSLASKIPRDEAAGFAIEQATDPTNFMAAAGKLPGVAGVIKKLDGPLLHGTPKKFPLSEIRPSKGGHVGPGVYFTDDAGAASNFGTNVLKATPKKTAIVDFVKDDKDMKMLAKKLGVDDLLKEQTSSKLYRGGSQDRYFAIKQAYIDKIDPDYKLVGNERDTAFHNALKDLGFTGVKYEWNGKNAFNIFDPSNLQEAGEDAAAILSKYDTLDKVKKIRGTDEYSKYLKALDETYGDVATRSKGLGFGDDTWYHGSFNDFNEFSPVSKRREKNFLGRSIYTTNSPLDAEMNYARMDGPDNRIKFLERWKELEGGGMREELAREAAQKEIFGDKKFGNVIELRMRSENPINLTEKYGTQTGYVNLYDTANDILSKSGKKKISAVTNRAPGEILRKELVNSGHDVALVSPGKQWKGFPYVDDKTVHAMAQNENQLRKTSAAFDPRFKDEADLLAGGLGTVNGKGLIGMAAGKANKTDDFDPDAYLAGNDFDPDAYLASKEEKPMVTGEGLLRGTLKALPIAGSLAGGAMGTVLGPAGTLGGGMLGAAGGKILQNAGETLLGDEKTERELYLDPVKEAAYEAAGAGAGKLVGVAAGKVAPYVERGLLKPARDFFGKFGAQNKAGSEVLQEAGERIGVQPTRGMLTGEPVVQKIESGLAQTPTGAGQQVAEQLQNVQTGMKNAGEEVLTAGKTPETVQQMAQSAKEQVMGSIKKSIEPAAEIYRKIEGEARAIGVAEVSRKRISNNIRNVPYAKIKGSAESSFANQIADNLENVKSLEELRNLRSYVGKQLGDPNISSTMKETAGELYGRLGKLEQNSITRAALDAAANPQHGRSVAKAMIGEIKQANKIYSQVSNELKEIAASTGMGKVNNYGDFIRKMEALPDEKFVSKLFTPGNVKNLKAVQKQFPEAFEVMRKSHLADLYNKSVTKGEVSIPKLIQNSRKLSKEAKELIFGPKADQTLKDIETVYNATYQKVGPSGTPEGQAFMKFSPFSPTAWFNSMKASTTKWLLDNPELARKFAGAPATKQLYKNIPKEMSQQIADETKKRFMYSTTPRATGLLMEENNE